MGDVDGDGVVVAVELAGAEEPTLEEADCVANTEAGLLVDAEMDAVREVDAEGVGIDVDVRVAVVVPLVVRDADAVQDAVRDGVQVAVLVRDVVGDFAGVLLGVSEREVVAVPVVVTVVDTGAERLCDAELVVEPAADTDNDAGTLVLAVSVGADDTEGVSLAVADTDSDPLVVARSDSEGLGLVGDVGLTLGNALSEALRLTDSAGVAVAKLESVTEAVGVAGSLRMTSGESEADVVSVSDAGEEGDSVDSVVMVAAVAVMGTVAVAGRLALQLAVTLDSKVSGLTNCDIVAVMLEESDAAGDSGTVLVSAAELSLVGLRVGLAHDGDTVADSEGRVAADAEIDAMVLTESLPVRETDGVCVVFFTPFFKPGVDGDGVIEGDAVLDTDRVIEAVLLGVANRDTDTLGEGDSEPVISDRSRIDAASGVVELNG